MLCMEHTHAPLTPVTDGGREAGEGPEPTVEMLVARARHGDNDAWEQILDRFGALVRSTTRAYRLSPTDAADVGQTVWLRLFERLADLREPRALPGWIAVTTAHECSKVVTRRNRTVSVDPVLLAGGEHPAFSSPAGPTEPGEPGERLLREDDRRAIRSGLAQLPARQRQLLLLLTQDPPLPYAEIGRRLGIPVGSIGPARARYLRHLRQTAAVRAVVDADPAA
jgi:RNA polymerase sigma factor (sigma-70 family)